MNERIPLRATTDELPGPILAIRVSGVLDAETHRAASAEVESAFARKPVAVVLDLTAVDFMGSSGIAVLINAHHRANRLGIAFAVVANTRSVLRPLRVSQVDGTLALHPTVDEAIAAVRLVST
ncbi:STAS domain-containing protein [Saccharothrix coeruleofusca]|uniref:Anti-sigma factor antagonist n=1 Tax=Saccharothrix coeruleofusca TaxID=33919 RepID=A0A918ARZ1_9PSEU|nr:STAS domain-containing protein [Saccharothrix coeruleofusca]MBP2335761.1 anti-anti-sigma factor [Saccharothrix coeruleofusca]GGP75321.1 anti-sigma factor antagonist [Saccharothrix coeruleofusca]